MANNNHNSNRKTTPATDAFPDGHLDESTNGLVPQSTVSGADSSKEKASTILANRMSADSGSNSNSGSDLSASNHNNTESNTNTQTSTGKTMLMRSYFLCSKREGGILPEALATDEAIAVPMSLRNMYAGFTFKADPWKKSDPGNLRTSLARKVLEANLPVTDLMAILQGIFCENQVKLSDLVKLKVKLTDYESNMNTDHMVFAEHHLFTILNALSQLSVAMRVCIIRHHMDGDLHNKLVNDEDWASDDTRAELEALAKRSKLNELIDSPDCTWLLKREIKSEQLSFSAKRNADTNRVSARNAFIEQVLKLYIANGKFLPWFTWCFDFGIFMRVLKVPLSMKPDHIAEGTTEWQWFCHDGRVSKGIAKTYARYIDVGTEADGEMEGSVVRWSQPTEAAPNGQRTFSIWSPMVSKDETGKEFVTDVVVINQPVVLERYSVTQRKAEETALAKLTAELLDSIKKRSAKKKRVHTGVDQLPFVMRSEEPLIKKKSAKSETDDSDSDDEDDSEDERMHHKRVQKSSDSHSRNATNPGRVQGMDEDDALQALQELKEAAPKKSKPKKVSFFDRMLNGFPSSCHADPAYMQERLRERNKMIVDTSRIVRHYRERAREAWDGKTFHGEVMDEMKATATLRWEAVALFCQHGAYHGLPYVEYKMLQCILPKLSQADQDGLVTFQESQYLRSLTEWREKDKIDATGKRLKSFRATAGWEIELDNGESGVLAKLMKNDTVRRHLERTDTLLAERRSKRDARAASLDSNRPFKRFKLDCGGIERSMASIEAEHKMDGPYAQTPNAWANAPCPNSYPNRFGFNAEAEADARTNSTPSLSLDSGYDTTQFYTTNIDAQLNQRQSYINSRIEPQSNSNNRVAHGRSSGVQTNSSTGSSPEQLRALKAMQSQLDTPLQHCSDPKAWAEKNHLRGAENLSPLRKVIDKKSGIFTALSLEAVAMKTQATVAVETDSWMNFATMRSVHSKRKDRGDLDKVVAIVRDGSNGTTYKSKQLESASALIYLFRVMCCDWNDHIIAPYEALFDCYRLSEHFQTMCQAKGTSCSKMIVFKHLLADPTVIVTCMMQILKQYRMFFNMVDLNTHHFEKLAQLLIDHPEIHSDVVALPDCVRSLKGLNRRLVTVWKFMGRIMIVDVMFLVKYMKSFIQKHTDEKFAAFMHFRDITSYACKNGVSFARAIANPTVRVGYEMHVGSSVNPCTLFVCLTDGTVNAQLIEKAKVDRAQKLFDENDSDIDDLSDLDGLETDSMGELSPAKLSKSKKRKTTSEKEKPPLSAEDKLRKKRKRRKSVTRKRLQAILRKRGGLKPRYAMKVPKSCKIYLHDGKCDFAGSGVCGPGTQHGHKCVCNGKHALGDCKKDIWNKKE